VRVKVATLAAAVLVVALLVNHWWVGVQVARITAAAGLPPGATNDFGVVLPGYLKFLVKLDHLAQRYGYVLIPIAWVAAFVVASVVLGLRDFLGGPKPAGIAED
jgi:hypothetical protein